MQILVVESRHTDLTAITDIIGKVRPDAEILCAENGGEALRLAADRHIDAVFLDPELPGISGPELAQRLKNGQTGINIIYTAENESFMREAFDMHASGYLIKPVTEVMVSRELSDLRNRCEIPENRVRVVTFGYFAVFIDDIPVQFRYSKTEELFAILVDRCGEAVGADQAVKLLWEDEGGAVKHLSYLSSLKKDLFQTFSSRGIKGIIRREGKKYAIVPDRIKCDYYDYLNGKEGAEPFKDRYMERYPWAESTLGFLDSIARKRKES